MSSAKRELEELMDREERDSLVPCVMCKRKKVNPADMPYDGGVMVYAICDSCAFKDAECQP